MEPLLKNGEIIEENSIKYKVRWIEVPIKCQDGNDSVEICLPKAIEVQDPDPDPHPVPNYLGEKIDEGGLVDQGPEHVYLKRGEVFTDYMGRCWYHSTDGKVYKVIKSQVVQPPKYDNEVQPTEFRNKTLEEVEKKAKYLSEGFGLWLDKQNHPEPEFLP